MCSWNGGKCPSPTRANVILVALFDMTISLLVGACAIFFLVISSQPKALDNTIAWYNYLSKNDNNSDNDDDDSDRDFISVITLMLLEMVIYVPLSTLLLFGAITKNPTFIRISFGKNDGFLIFF